MKPHVNRSGNTNTADANALPLSNPCDAPIHTRVQMEVHSHLQWSSSWSCQNIAFNLAFFSDACAFSCTPRKVQFCLCMACIGLVEVTHSRNSTSHAGQETEESCERRRVCLPEIWCVVDLCMMTILGTQFFFKDCARKAQC